MISFKSLGHYIAVAARDVVKFGAPIMKAEPIVEGTTALVAPSAVVIERAAFSALGYITDAANQATPVADGTTPLTITIAADEIADFKAIAAAFKQPALANGVTV